MSVSNSKTDIVNLSFDLIKTENINNVEVPGDDKSAVIANRWYDDVRQTALQGFPWNFASTRKSIPLNSEAPSFGFDDAYLLPNDYLSLNFIVDWTLPLSQWNYNIENGSIYIDNSEAESLDIGYVFDQLQTAKYSAAFKMYLAYSLAEKILFKLTGNVSLMNRIITAKKSAEVNAKAVNGKDNPPVAFRRSRMLDARRIFGGSRTTGIFRGRHGRA